MKFSRDAAISRIPAPHLLKQGQLQLAGASFRDKIVAQARDFSATKLCVKHIPPPQCVEFAAWSDASFANAAQWKSQGGYLICAADARLRLDEWAVLSPLRWRSYKQNRQVASTLGAELMTLSRTISEAKWIRSLWTEAVYVNYKLEEDQLWTSRTPVTVAVDSRPVFDHLNGQLMTIKDKKEIGYRNVVGQERCIK